MPSTSGLAAAMAANREANMELGKREYWHGTKPQSAVCIVCEGFRIDPEFGISGRGGSFREAIYLTKSLETARSFGEYIVRCALSAGTRILRLDNTYDTKTVQYLRREFGKEVLGPRFSSVLPPNKHLTKKELISLLNFVFSKAEKERAKEREWLNWHGNLTWIRDQLRRHAFHAVGRVDDMHGIAVLAPSRVTCVQVYDGREMRMGCGESVDLKPPDPAVLASDVRGWIRNEELWAKETPEFCLTESVIERVRENLCRFENRSVGS